MVFSGEMTGFWLFKKCCFFALLQNTTWVILQIPTGPLICLSYIWDGWCCDVCELHKEGLPSLQCTETGHKKLGTILMVLLDLYMSFETIYSTFLMYLALLCCHCFWGLYLLNLVNICWITTWMFSIVIVLVLRSVTLLRLLSDV